MEYFQNKRYIKSKKESYEILDILNLEEEYIFYILSKTLNIYSVSINKENNEINCDCPDSKDFCLKYDCICKHSCYILFNVLKVYKIINNIKNIKYISSDKMGLIKENKLFIS
jgi:hypothetical protein